MSDIPVLSLAHTILFLSLPFIFGYAAYKFRLPTIIGYIAGGVALSFFVQSEVSEILSFFANIGLILLLFTLGLEIDLTSLRRFSRYAFVGGALQVAFTAGSVFILAIIFKLTLIPSIILSLGFAMSSTAIVSKLLTDRGGESSLLGQLSLGILIFQDMVAIPLILVVSSFSDSLTGTALITSISGSIIKAVVIIAIMLVAGERIVPPLFAKVGKLSRELINLFTIIFIFAAVFLFSVLGLSASLAAFVAGMLIGQSLSHHHIFSQMRPFRDLFVILFFVFLGASVEISTLLPILPIVIVFSIIVIFIKIVILQLIFMWLRFHTKTAYSVGVLLSQVGEFAFIMFHVGFITGLLDVRTYAMAVGVTITTMVLSPFIIERREKIYNRLRKIIKKRLPFVDKYLMYAVDREPANIDVMTIKNHIVLAGYGRVGSYIGRALQLADIPYIAVELNLQIVEKARKQGINIIYGDATDIDILDYLQVEHASCLVATVPDNLEQELIILNTKILNPKLAIFTRVEQEKVQKRMKDLGAKLVVQPEFEAALAIVRRLFTGFDMEPSDVEKRIKRLKLEHGMD